MSHVSVQLKNIYTCTRFGSLCWRRNFADTCRSLPCTFASTWYQVENNPPCFYDLSIERAHTQKHKRVNMKSLLFCIHTANHFQDAFSANQLYCDCDGVTDDTPTEITQVYTHHANHLHFWDCKARSDVSSNSSLAGRDIALRNYIILSHYNTKLQENQFCFMN